VVTSSTDGNELNASGLGRYIATISRMAEMHMFTAISASTSHVGSGRIIMKMMQTMSAASTRSLRCTMNCSVRCMRPLLMAGSRPLRGGAAG
jgi:hypothetical protein